jgi:hypothetical protein
VIATYWAVFWLGRAIVGLSHAALAVLLMVGIAAFTVETPEFGPAVLAMPLAALALMFWWRAVGEAQASAWLMLGGVLGLLMLTTWFGAILLGLLLAFTAATPRGRAAVKGIHPYAAVAIAFLIAAPHLYWLLGAGAAAAAQDFGIAAAAAEWMRLLAGLLSDHAGLLVLVIVASALVADRKVLVPEIVREPIDRSAQLFVYVFALAPALIATLVAALRGQSAPVGGEGALVVLTALAVIVAAGNAIRLYRQRAASLTWVALLFAPPILAAVSVLVLPWTFAVELKVNEPAAAMGRFFTDSFNRRTGRPLAIVVGEARLGGLIALASPDRPSLFIDASPQRAPWLSDEDLRQKGAIVVWPINDAAGAPPAHLRARFPDLVPEVPRAFERPIQGRLPLMRVGWAMIRPAN